MAYDVSHAPAEYAAGEAERRRRWIRVGFGAYALLAVAWLLLAADDRLPSGTLLAAVCLGFLVRPGVRAYLASENNWRRGAEAERAVGTVLNELRRERWIVMHDVAQRYEGNIDHIVSGPGGVFMVETKLRRYEARQLTKAKRQAAKLHDELGVWVTPVIALHARRDPKCFKTKGVWIVPRQSLLDWFRSRHEPVVEFERLARFADRL
jgi:hypothetical protein